jgi:hypothetical protein
LRYVIECLPVIRKSREEGWMATSGKEDRGTIRSKWDWLSGFTSPQDGWVVPREGTADGELPGGTRVHVEIEVAEGRARARRVTVESDQPHGVGWRALAKAPVRDMVATAVLGGLYRTMPGDEGAVQLVPLEPKDAEEALEVVRAAVGYKPDTEGFIREVG